MLAPMAWFRRSSSSRISEPSGAITPGCGEPCPTGGTVWPGLCCIFTSRLSIAPNRRIEVLARKPDYRPYYRPGTIGPVLSALLSARYYRPGTIGPVLSARYYRPGTIGPVLSARYYRPGTIGPVLSARYYRPGTIGPVLSARYYRPGTIGPVLSARYYRPGTIGPVLSARYYRPGTIVEGTLLPAPNKG